MGARGLSKRWLVIAGCGCAALLAVFVGRVALNAEAQPPTGAPSAALPPPAPAPAPAEAAPMVAAQPTAAATTRPAPAPTPDRVGEVAAHVAASWGRDWVATIGALELLMRLEPENAVWPEKLYAAYVEDADQRRAEGRLGEARWRLEQALALDPARGVAQARLRALDPRSALPQPVRDYLDTQQPLFSALLDALRHLEEQQGRLAGQPALLSDADWLGRTDAALAVIRSAGREIQRYDPAPNQVAAIDGRTAVLGRAVVERAAAYARAVEAGDAAAADRAMSALDETSAALRDLSAQLSAVEAE